jgi:hypothetical protein
LPALVALPAFRHRLTLQQRPAGAGA